MSNLKHGKRIVTETYYNGEVSNTVEELMADKFTDKQSLLKEIIESLAIVTNGTSTKLTLEICIDKHNRYRIKQRWSV